MTDRIEEILRDAQQDRTFSCAAWSVGTADRIDSAGVIGELFWGGPSADADTLWDLASVTKPIVAMAVMALIQDGRLTLDDSVGLHLREYRGTDKEQLTVRQLLTHTSGFPGGLPMYRWCASRQAVLDEIRGVSLKFAPGTDVEYSSQGFIVLGLIAELAAGMPLDELVRCTVTGPAGMPATRFRLDPADRASAAATEDCPWRGGVVQGTVHDENAEVLGGVAGHAGLFASLTDLQMLGQLLCRGARGEDTEVMSARTLATMIAPATDHLRLRRSLGWQGRDPAMSPAGDLAGSGTFGHTGFTGTTVWVDPDAGRYVVLLTNRVHPTRRNGQLPRIRRLVHNVGFGRPGGTD
ncbi:serine hydrolase domain-containing protein [Nakamurella lactea]|uniref:serine hydrolase domain-containing protein n=1 Tax=Nakamurella lactea TaxID=459515 RepID=UPI0003F57A3C|nr:serine hydrolase domain-containing protein [Nakamurella lactea]